MSVVRIWDISSGRLLHTFEGHDDWAGSVVWDPTGEKIATNCEAKGVRIWHADSGELLHILERRERARSMAWDPAGEKLAVASDSNVEIWEVATQRL